MAKTNHRTYARLILIAVTLTLFVSLIKNVHSDTPSPILEYRFEEGSGSTTANTGSYLNADGLLVSGASFSTDVPSNIGSTASLALLTGAPNTAVNIPDNFNYTVDGLAGSQRLGQITVEAWVKPTNLQLHGEDNRPVWDDYGNPGVLLTLKSDGAVGFSVATPSDPKGSFGNRSGQVTVGAWQHIAGVYDGAELRVFINGQDTCEPVSKTGLIIDQSTAFPGAPIRIGNTPGDIKSYEGFIDDVQVYSVALDRTQLANGFFANTPAVSCDDLDGDTILDDSDNCPAISNPDQADYDNDGQGDVCDPDDDNDGINDDADSCPFEDATGFDADNDGCIDDTTPPVITPNVSGSLGNNDWYTGDVSLSWTVADPESGVAFSAGCDPTTLTTDTTGVTLTCLVTNGAGLSDSVSVSIKLDKTPPNVTITSPADGSTPLLNTVVASDYNCADSTSGVVTCSGLVPSGATIDTTSVGAKSFTVNATDYAGNNTVVTHNYNVIYDFNGFSPPVDNPPILNAVKAGNAVPVKFSLSGDQGLGIFASGYPKSQQISCDNKAPLDDIEETETSGSSSLSYSNSNDQYNYVWKTEKGWSGTCRQLTVQLKDGVTHSANFKFK
ncbi:MAG: PxKF domain-containing protein [Anaerolineaceae bacterium]|nr:PxKF domain-containing protein [Anaerolineaceae bacterium]